MGGGPGREKGGKRRREREQGGRVRESYKGEEGEGAGESVRERGIAGGTVRRGAEGPRVRFRSLYK